ncbi:hypothetical protein [Marinobacter sp.]|uniref:hypothetical protein n=1 Tax=Marinobacter sp. TaxID=50741 RepID=UPI003F990FAC
MKSVVLMFVGGLVGGLIGPVSALVGGVTGYLVGRALMHPAAAKPNEKPSSCR